MFNPLRLDLLPRPYDEVLRMRQNNETLRVGMVGLGHIYPSHRAALSLIPEFQVVAVCDIDRGKKEAVKDVNFYTDLSKFLQVELDVVVVATPNASHYKVASAALRGGKDVLLEKPATESLEQLRTLYELADSQQRLLVVSYHAAFGREVRWFEEQDRCDYGRVVSFHCALYDPYCQNTHIGRESRGLGGSWSDSGINALCVLDRFVTDLRVEEGRFTILPDLFEGEIQGTVDLSFRSEEGRGYGSVDTNWTLGLNRKQTIFMFESGSSVCLDHSNQSVFKYTSIGESEKIADLAGRHLRLTEHYLGVFSDFLVRVRERRDNRSASLRLHKQLFDAWKKRLCGKTLP